MDVIDKNRLHEEWINQDREFGRAAKEFVTCQKELATAEERVKTIRSRIILDVKASDPKATGQIIEAKYRTDDKYIAAKNAWIDVQYRHAQAEHRVKQLYQRKGALENLVALWKRDYFVSRVPKGLGSDPTSQALQNETEGASVGALKKLGDQMKRDKKPKRMKRKK